MIYSSTYALISIYKHRACQSYIAVAAFPWATLSKILYCIWLIGMYQSCMRGEGTPFFFTFSQHLHARYCASLARQYCYRPKRSRLRPSRARVLRSDRRIDCSFRVTQLSTVRPFGALSSRFDLREFQCTFSLLVLSGKALVYKPF